MLMGGCGESGLGSGYLGWGMRGAGIVQGAILLLNHFFWKKVENAQDYI